MGDDIGFTVRGTLQELEDVLRHVAARGDCLDPAAYPVPLRLGPDAALFVDSAAFSVVTSNSQVKS